jgi:hypothetical protein
MPSGYTADIHDGKNPTFREYALGCARAFGALISMRDDPHDKPVPRELEPATHHRDERDKALARLGELVKMSDWACNWEAERHYEEQSERRAERLADGQRLRQDYDAMLEKARRFVSPSPEHDGYARFLIEHLEESKQFDTMSPKEIEKYEKPLERSTGAEWRENEITRVMNSLSYHSEQWAKEVGRTIERNKWLKELFDALDEMGE